MTAGIALSWEARNGRQDMLVMPEVEPYLSPAEVAEVLGVNSVTVLRSLVEGPVEEGSDRISGYRVPIGRKDWSVSLSEVRRLLDKAHNPPLMEARLQDLLERRASVGGEGPRRAKD